MPNVDARWMRRDAAELVAWIDRRGGAAHSSTARAAGFSAHAMRSAVATDMVRRVRRSWLVTPASDEPHRIAASVSGRVTCVTAASAMGLWTPAHAGVHLAVAPTASRVGGEWTDADVRLHWSQGPAPTGRFDLRDPIVNVLFHVARCIERRDAMAVWESALHRRLVDAEELARIEWHSDAARRLAATASQLSDSGLETRFIDLLRSIGVDVRQQVVIDGRPVDGLVGERLVCQLDGFAFHQAADRRRDLRADARLVLRGWTVLRFDYDQVFFEPRYVTDTVSMAIAQGLHRG